MHLLYCAVGPSREAGNSWRISQHCARSSHSEREIRALRLSAALDLVGMGLPCKLLYPAAWHLTT